MTDYKRLQKRAYPSTAARSDRLNPGKETVT
jgi:hypothetical protein